MTLGCNSFTIAISDPFVMFAALVPLPVGFAQGVLAPLPVVKASLWSEKTGNVVAHLLPYLLHLMFVALWRKPVICRCPYGSC